MKKEESTRPPPVTTNDVAVKNKIIKLYEYAYNFIQIE